MAVVLAGRQPSPNFADGRSIPGPDALLGACVACPRHLSSRAVPSLLQKIEASAKARLTFPAGTRREERLARYQRFLKVETHRLKMLHRAGAGGREICQARAAVLDAMIRRIVAGVEAALPEKSRTRAPFALVAIGGYGRGELNPCSDIDILFLHDGALATKARVHPYLEALLQTDGLLYTLYDIGLKVGHSVRSVDECVVVANHDMQSKTSLLEARLILGDAPLFAALQQAVANKCVKGRENDYIAARLADQTARQAKFGNSACMQEPHLKNGCGGLRDYQNLFWLAFVQFGVHTAEELRQLEFISAAEARQLDNAYDFLLRTRTELHYHADRALDVLTRNTQARVALRLGFGDRSPSRRVEKFMRALYIHMRDVHLITRTLEQRLAMAPQARRLTSWRQLLPFVRRTAVEQTADGFRFVNGHIEASSSRVFREQPRRLMRVFLHAQKRGLRLHPDLTQLIRQSTALMDRKFLADEHVHQTFLEILNQRGNVARILRAMHEVDLLGKYVPEFGRLTCRVQHEFYHQYAADEHTLACLEMLDRVWEASAAPFNKYSAMLQTLDRPFVLYLALLLHDVGKAGDSGKHARSGALASVGVARRLGLDERTTESLRLIIEHHILLAKVSQRRDLDDPAVIRHVAECVHTPENLMRLTLHTFADAMGTSTDMWNDFKDSLLWTLHHQVHRLLTGGLEFLEAAEQRHEALQAEVRRLVPSTFTDEEVDSHFESLPARYFASHSREAILTDVTVAHRFMHRALEMEEDALKPVVQWHNEPDRGYTTVKVCTWDRAGLFCKITGSLAAAGLNILSAQIFSRGDGIVLDTFFVTDARTGKLVNREEREAFERTLHGALNGDVKLETQIARRKAASTLFQALEGERIPTVIRFDNNSSDARTVIELETEDRVGLLFAISHVFGELGLDISLAKIVTEKGAAIDSFYVAEKEGGKVTTRERQRQVEQKLRAAITRLDRW
jgi:[protein-PII] uridylyltransferase